jgi:hypothetical protein
VGAFAPPGEPSKKKLLEIDAPPIFVLTLAHTIVQTPINLIVLTPPVVDVSVLTALGGDDDMLLC